MLKCDVCGKVSKISIEKADKTDAHYCADCYNNEMAQLMDFNLPDIVPKHLDLNDCNGKAHRFAIEYMLFPNGQSLQAWEEGEAEYRCCVYGDLDENFMPVWFRLLDRLQKMLSVKYIEKGRWTEDRVEGYVRWSEKDGCEVVVDGVPYTWEELGENVSSYEGFRIRIEIVDATDEF